MDFASMLSKEYFEAMQKKGTPNAADVYPIGTGPFEFGSYQKDAVIRYKAFDKYWKGRPKIDNLVYAITPDPTSRPVSRYSGETPSLRASSLSALNDGVRSPFSIREMYA